MILESHGLGLGNLTRYIQDIRGLRNGIVVEDYWVVLPSTMAPGEYPLRIGLQSPLPVWAGADSALNTDKVELGWITVGEAGQALSVDADEALVVPVPKENDP
jgi:hypothetical protein